MVKISQEACADHVANVAAKYETALEMRRESLDAAYWRIKGLEELVGNLAKAIEIDDPARRLEVAATHIQHFNERPW